MKDDLKWNLLAQRVNHLQTVEAFEKLTAHGIDCIVIKGPAVGRFYPAEKPRVSVDVDLAVASGDYEKSMKLFDEGKLGAFNVDLHESLKNLDTRPFEEIFPKTQFLELEEGKIRVLSDEDQLRVICVHWLTDGGEREDRLWDIHYAVKRRAAGFDWDYFLDANGPIRRRWLISAIGIAHRYTGLDLEGLPYREEYERLPEWLVRTVESRWADDVKFAPIDQQFNNPVMFMRQLKRRFPPNPLMATIALQEDFDTGHRLPIQLRYILKRAIPSLKRSMQTLWRAIFR